MEMFEYVMVLASIIVGLGITHLLTGVAGLVQRPAGARVSWLHLVWVAYIFLLTIFWWWFEFRLQEKISVWTFQLYLLIVVYAVIVYLLCAILFPRDLEPEGDYEAYLMDRRGWFFGLCIAFGLIDVADTWVKGADHFASLGPRYLIINGATLLLFAIAIKIRDLRFQWPFAVAILVNQFLFVLRSFDTVS